MSPSSASKSAKLDPLPEYPEIILALNLLGGGVLLLFHWPLFVPEPGATRDTVSDGKKMHATSSMPDGENLVWTYECTEFALGVSHTVAAAAVLGRLPAGKTVEDLSNILKDIPMTIPAVDAAREQEFTCRVWVREAVRRMHTHGYIDCRDVDGLEQEMWQYGREAASRRRGRPAQHASLVNAVNSRAV